MGKKSCERSCIFCVFKFLVTTLLSLDFCFVFLVVCVNLLLVVEKFLFVGFYIVLLLVIWVLGRVKCLKSC